MSPSRPLRLAVDLGASGGRVVLGRARPEGFDLTEAHRFEHHAGLRDGRLRWDWERIVAGVRDSVTGCPISSISPRAGWRTFCAMPTCRTCGSSNISSIL